MTPQSHRGDSIIPSALDSRIERWIENPMTMGFGSHGHGDRIPSSRDSTPTRLIEDPIVVGSQSQGDGILVSTRWIDNPITLGFSIIAMGSQSHGDGSTIPSGIDSHPMPDRSPSIVESIPAPPVAPTDPSRDPSAHITDATRFDRERYGDPTRVRIECDALGIADPDHGSEIDPGVSLNPSRDPFPPLAGAFPGLTRWGCD
jgi:hypothetical protein